LKWPRFSASRRFWSVLTNYGLIFVTFGVLGPPSAAEFISKKALIFKDNKTANHLFFISQEF
jgi:hypothetical protein